MIFKTQFLMKYWKFVNNSASYKRIGKFPFDKISVRCQHSWRHFRNHNDAILNLEQNQFTYLFRTAYFEKIEETVGICRHLRKFIIHSHSVSFLQTLDSKFLKLSLVFRKHNWCKKNETPLTSGYQNIVSSTINHQSWLRRIYKEIFTTTKGKYFKKLTFIFLPLK